MIGEPIDHDVMERILYVARERLGDAVSALGMRQAVRDAVDNTIPDLIAAEVTAVELLP